MSTAVDPHTQAISVMAPQQMIQRSIPLLERQVDDAIAAHPPAIDLVLSAVQITDSSGLNWLLALHIRLDTLGIRLRLVNPSSIMTDAMIATRLDSRLTIQNTHIPESQGGAHGRS